MTFTRESIETLEAMGLGPVWLLRETTDPTLPETLRAPARDVRAAAAPAAAPAPGAAARRQADVFGTRPAAPAAPAALRRESRPAAAAAAPETSKPAAAGAVMPPDLIAGIRAAGWGELEALARECRCCAMASSRQNVVFAQGEPGPRLAVIGEAPGAEEDLQGVPFVGKSGQLLTAMLDSLGIVRGRDCTVLNVLKCRPPRNRNPEPAEIACCGHWLTRQLELLRPDALLLSGRFAVDAILHPGEGFSIGRLRGRIHSAELSDGRTVPAVVTYHPSYLLRSPDAKAKAWEDLVLLREAMTAAGITLPERPKKWD